MQNIEILGRHNGSKASGHDRAGALGDIEGQKVRLLKTCENKLRNEFRAQETQKLEKPFASC